MLLSYISFQVLSSFLTAMQITCLPLIIQAVMYALVTIHMAIQYTVCIVNCFVIAIKLSRETRNNK